MRYIFRVSVVLLILSMAFFVCLAEEHVILTIHNECVSDDLLSSFMREHPSIRIEEHNDPEDSNITIEEALSHSDNVDIYFMNTLTSRTYEALRDRGYFLELTDPEILAMANSIYSEVRKAAIYNDNLCALPYEIQGQPVFAVDMNIWLFWDSLKMNFPERGQIYCVFALKNGRPFQWNMKKSRCSVNLTSMQLICWGGLRRTTKHTERSMIII